MDMDKRKKMVLLAIIQDYISTAEPVGSRTISRKYKLGVSPATIRNEMADLEELGYIEQPHTSAGRIPSDLGYRYYVDYLMQPQELTFAEKDLIDKNYADKTVELGKIISCTGQLLSKLTNYTALVMVPQGENQAIKHIQIVSMQPTKAMVIVVLENGSVYHQLIDVAENITQVDLDQVSAILNNRLSGQSAQQIRLSLLKEIYFELAKYKNFLDVALELIEGNSKERNQSQIYLGGVYNILNQPEFHDIEKLKTLLSLLEQEKLLKQILKNKEEKGVSICIGVENHYEQIKECTMITASYHMSDKILGTIGVLGPTRMEYAKVITVVDHLTRVLNENLKKL